MTNYDQLFSFLSQEVPLLAHNILGGYSGQATKDVQKFVSSLETDLKSWIASFSKGELTIADLEFLLKGKRDLAEMHALKQAGLAKVTLDRFKDAVLGAIIKGIQTSI